MSFFQSNLKILRKAKNLKQREVAESVGIKVCSYQAYEEGRANPRFEGLAKIADFFEVTTNDLVLTDLKAPDEINSEPIQ